MKSVDIIHSYLVLIFGLLYIFISLHVKYKNKNNELTDKEKSLLLINNIIGFIFGVIFASYEVRFLRTNCPSFIRYFMFLVCIILIFVCYYGSVYNDDPNSNVGRLSNFVWPLFGSIIIISESMLNQILVNFRNDYKIFSESKSTDSF